VVYSVGLYHVCTWAYQVLGLTFLN
jgi:hypothetical protein